MVRKTEQALISHKTSNLEQGKNPAKAANCLQVLAHPARLLILEALRDGEKSVGELEKACNCSQSGVSQHLRIMRDREILVSRKVANKVYYRISDPRIINIIDAVKEVFCGLVEE